MYLSDRRSRYEFIQKAKIPWSAFPNWPAPARTPHRLIQTGNPNVAPYSSASTSDASLVLPYNDTGADVLKDSAMPRALMPAGRGLPSSSSSRAPRGAIG